METPRSPGHGRNAIHFHHICLYLFVANWSWTSNQSTSCECLVINIRVLLVFFFFWSRNMDGEWMAFGRGKAMPKKKKKNSLNNANLVICVYSTFAYRIAACGLHIVSGIFVNGLFIWFKSKQQRKRWNGGFDLKLGPRARGNLELWFVLCEWLWFFSKIVKHPQKFWFWQINECIVDI